MRLPTSKVYRAFPELDHFSDEQCLAFVQSADRRRSGRAVRILLQFVLSGAAFVGLTAASIYLADLLRKSTTLNRNATDPYMLWAGLSMLVVFAGTGAAWLVSRDLLLRRAIRRVMTERGSCSTCGYGLTGLPVTADLRVVCPECGTAILADASLGEALPDGSGQVRFIPSPDAVPAPRTWLKPATKKRVRRALIWGPLAVVFLAIALAGGWELYIRVQARRAAGLRTPPTAVAGLVMAQQGMGVGDTNGWLVLMTAVKGLEAVETDLLEAKYPGRSTMNWNVNFMAIFDPQAAQQYWQTETPEAQRDVAVALLRAWKEAGAWDAVREAAVARTAVRPIAAPGGQPLGWGMVADVWKSQRVSFAGAARMKLAEDAGDQREWLEAWEINVGLGRLAASQASLFDLSIAAWIDDVNAKRASGMAMAHPGGPWAAAALRLWLDHDPPDDATVILKGEEALARDTIAWVFEQPGRTRFGLRSIGEEFTGPAGPWAVKPTGRLGTLHANLDTLAGEFARLTAEAAKEPHQRSAFTPGWTPGPYFLVNAASPYAPQALIVIDRRRVLRRGTALVLGLEAFRAAHGRYPPRIEDLSPSILPALPLDPYSGRPFVYRVDAGGTGYRLYSIGADGVDGGGDSDASQGGSDIVIHASPTAP